MTFARQWWLAGLAGLILASPAGQLRAEDLSVPPPGYTYRAPAECPFPTVRYAACEDQMQRLADALAKAKSQGKLLLVVMGADWCPWCKSLHELLPSDKVLSHTGDGFDYAGRYTHTHIATSAVAGGKRVGISSGIAAEDLLVARSGAPRQTRSIPYLAIVDPASGKVLHRGMDDLEDSWNVEQAHDPAKLRQVLRDSHAKLRP